MVVRYANGAAAVFLESARDQVEGAVITKHVKDQEILDALAAAAGEQRQRTTIEIEKDQDGGRGVFRFTVRPVRREDGLAAMVMIEDVTQMRVADEARNQFVAQATHELRTPLTNMRLYLEMLLEEDEDDPEIKANALNEIGRASCRERV